MLRATKRPILIKSEGWNRLTYIFALLVECVELKELLLLLVVVVGADKDKDEHGQEDSEALNPGYNYFKFSN
jgi:hypothetical protein